MISNEIVLNLAHKLGFTLAGFTPAEKLITETEHLSEWLAKKYHAGMMYMEKNFDKRLDINQILPGAKSVISLGMNYYKGEEYSGIPGTGKVSRYAQGTDYHEVIWKKLDLFISALKEIDPSFNAVSYVDTGPVMDKAWAVRAGLGWMGKHTNVINKEIGSWFFIANVITNYVFNPSTRVEDFCGSCTACLEACPTGALEEYVLNAGKCISYLTIENKNEIPSEFRGKMEKWVFGCDICQEVCPWNKRFSVLSGISEFDPVNKELNLQDVREMSLEEFSIRFRESPIKRAKLKGLKRNAEFLDSDKS